MFFTCKNFMFQFYVGKKIAAGNSGGLSPPPPFRTALVYYVNVSFDEKL